MTFELKQTPTHKVISKNPRNDFVALNSQKFTWHGIPFMVKHEKRNKLLDTYYLFRNHNSTVRDRDKINRKYSVLWVRSGRRKHSVSNLPN